MPKFVTLSCPSCSGKLKITKDLDKFACSYCGNEHVVKRSEGVVSLAPVVQGLQHIQTGVDKTASELAIVRLKKEIQGLENQIRNLSSPASELGIIIVKSLITLVASILPMLFLGSTATKILLTIQAIVFLGKVIQFSPTIQANRKAKTHNQLTQKKLEAKERQLMYHKKIVSQ